MTIIGEGKIMAVMSIGVSRNKGGVTVTALRNI